jgi:hypothetical protein
MKVCLVLLFVATPLIARHTSENHEDGVASTLWSRLASAAGTLGVDVGKAWATNVAIHSSEGLPINRNYILTVSVD